MKVHTDDFKNNIKMHGRELDSKITYYLNGNEIVLGNEDLNFITPHYNGSLLKSVMRELDIDSNVDIPRNTILKYELGVKINDSYEYINFGNYVVYSSEKQEDTNSYLITCYDKMLYSMIDYVDMNITYPISIRDYINAICLHLGLTFKNVSDTFANYDKMIPNEKYLDTNGNSLGYKFRDVLDELAQVTASVICINEVDDELEIRYIASLNPQPGKNLLNKNLGFQNGYINTSGNFIAQNTTATFNQKIEVENGETYCFSVNANVDNIVISMFGSNDNYLGRTKTTNTYKAVQSINNSNVVYIKCAFNYNNVATMTQEIINNCEPMLENNTDRTEPYEDYIDVSVDTINEEFLSDINVNFKQKYGPINTIVLSRSAGSDNIYYPAELPQNPVEVKISDNQIMNDNNRDIYMPDIYNKLNGLEYYINRFESPGICYYNLCDRFNVQIGENIYPCIMFNDEINITQGLKEDIYTDELEEAVTDYSKADKTDIKINQTNLIVDKQQGIIDALVDSTQDLIDYINTVEGDSEILLTDTMDSDGSINYVEITNFTPLYLYPGMAFPSNNVFPNEMTTYTIITQNDNNYNETYIDLGIQLVSTDKMIVEPSKITIIRNDTTIYQEKLNVFKTFDGNTRLSVKYLDDVHLKCQYIKENDFTKQFATQASVNANLSITRDLISSKVSKGDIISEINQSAEEVQIRADKISLEGKKINLTSDNVSINSNNFKVDENGNLQCNNANIENANITGGGINLFSDGYGSKQIRLNANDEIGTIEFYLNAYGFHAKNHDKRYNNDSSIDVSYTTTNSMAYLGFMLSAYSNDYMHNIINTITPSEINLSLYENGIQTSYTHITAESIYSPEFIPTSIAEKKKNFEKLNNALEILKKVDIYKYNLKSQPDNSKKHIGFVIGDSFNYSHELTDEKEQGADLYSFVSVCCQAIKEQQQIIEDLQKQINELKEVR